MWEAMLLHLARRDQYGRDSKEKNLRAHKNVFGTKGRLLTVKPLLDHL